MVSICDLLFLAAKIAASLQRFAISAPENPGVKVAKRLANSSTGVEGSSFRGLR